MKKQVAIPIIGVLAVGLIATGVFYLQGTNKLGDAQGEIAGLQGDVSGLEGDLAATEADLAASEATSGTLEVELADSEAEVSALGTALADSEAELADSTVRVATLVTELDQANSATQTQQELNLTLSEELEKVKDPRHFESLEELETWLAQDDTDTRIRWASVSPIERAFILQVRALRDGYLLSANFEDPDFDYIVDIVGNLAYIGDEIYYVWAGDDSVYPFAFGAPLIPSHPLPLD